MVEELSGQYTAAGRSHSGFSIQLQILYCLGKQLTSKQASRRDFETNKQASKRRASKSGNQASRGVFCLLACLSASLFVGACGEWQIATAMFYCSRSDGPDSSIGQTGRREKLRRLDQRLMDTSLRREEPLVRMALG
ncbi:uncharacterized protein K441DRAFT_213123 [Cenococcum geophilum 1.58]|uniref:uncharacterized protein n=1 Tax=Cenococcum geophilum 1.58 TaxID=794803 RepID=UPI00358F521B|nr:hypothetical protein K441DRAFT_213123 [Cenococcum geophilum 1.58]